MRRRRLNREHTCRWTENYTTKTRVEASWQTFFLRYPESIYPRTANSVKFGELSAGMGKSVPIHNEQQIRALVRYTTGLDTQIRTLIPYKTIVMTELAKGTTELLWKPKVQVDKRVSRRWRISWIYLSQGIGARRLADGGWEWMIVQ